VGKLSGLIIAIRDLERDRLEHKSIYVVCLVRFYLAK